MLACIERKQTYNYPKDLIGGQTVPSMLMKTAPLINIDHKKLFQSLTTAYIVFGVDDPTFTILEENEAHAAVAMVTRDKVIGRPLLEAFPDTSKQFKDTGVSQLLESVRRVIQTGKADAMPHLKYDLKDKKGKITQKYWSVVHHPVFDKTGAVIAVYQATEEITQKILTEKQLKLAQFQLSQALANGGIGTWVWDIVQGKIFPGENLSRIFGINRDDAKVGLQLDVFLTSIHPGDRKRVEGEINKAIKTHGDYESEYRIISKEGAIRWVIARGRVELNEDGEPVTFPGVVVDITDRKNTENNLHYLTTASTQFSTSLSLEKTLNNIASMVVPNLADWCSIELLDDDGQIQQVAVAHKDPKKVAWAKQLRDTQGPPDMSEPTGIPNVLRTGEPEHYPDITDEMIVLMAKDEEHLRLLRGIGFSSAIIAPLKIDNKTVGAITFVATESRAKYSEADLDMAKGLANRAAMAVDNANLYQAAQRELRARKRLQKQLEIMNDALEARVVERTKQLVETNEGLEKEIRKRKRVERELNEYGKNLARSNQELQDFAYVASHDLQEPLRKIQAFGDILANEYGKALGDGDEYLKRMLGAASRMSVLIQDLLSFSRVATKPQTITPVDLNTVVEDVVSDLETSININHGKVTVNKLPMVMADPTHMRQLFQNLIGNALKFHREDVVPEVTISAKPRAKADTHYEIYVADNGIGFDEKYLDRIFSVFQRLHGRDTYDGTGIGLAVCRKIAERYGGTIKATSKVGVGSTFTFQIPIKRKE